LQPSVWYWAQLSPGCGSRRFGCWHL
jgi:hypothetical protein